jgi:transcriptional regulator with XRE-family HTH domain
LLGRTLRDPPDFFLDFGPKTSAFSGYTQKRSRTAAFSALRHLSSMATTSTKKRQETGERLRLERERLGYSPQQIAQLLGVSLAIYERYEKGEEDPGIFRMPRLDACGFDILYIISGRRHTPIEEENELLTRFRDLSQRGRASIFTTLDALERLAPNLRQEIRKRFNR